MPGSHLTFNNQRLPRVWWASKRCLYLEATATTQVLLSPSYRKHCAAFFKESMDRDSKSIMAKGLSLSECSSHELSRQLLPLMARSRRRQGQIRILMVWAESAIDYYSGNWRNILQAEGSRNRCAVRPMLVVHQKPSQVASRKVFSSLQVQGFKIQLNTLYKTDLFCLQASQIYNTFNILVYTSIFETWNQYFVNVTVVSLCSRSFNTLSTSNKVILILRLLVAYKRGYNIVSLLVWSGCSIILNILEVNNCR